MVRLYRVNGSSMGDLSAEHLGEYNPPEQPQPTTSDDVEATQAVEGANQHPTPTRAARLDGHCHKPGEVQLD